ncbi:murein biosynthesis integral membrane protein MurJ [Parvularcula dongshanensis]|uniref:Probable lipid II flippase MurJ n=1 Tax=Parvularcula dongshanensis TaxID=1173995 RepID=A0A840I0V3_9PROT|nr:murein biosynthesis integral membrane protein MurJ [Parvularcula dongshanensis]MBB4657901.1 putative peptidoglycan lipid II flippase [Parvularcula dongshanensis]
MAGSLFRQAATVSGLTLVSRVLGFVRQMLLAGVIGASGNPVADAFWAAFRLPNMFRRLLAEGAFQAAFVPLFQGEEARGGLAEARTFAEDILAWLLVILTGLTALVMIFTPAFVGLIATGFADDPVRFDLTVLYTRIMFPYLACMSLVGLYGGMLNALHRFTAAAAAPVLLNICLVGGVWIVKGQSAPIIGLAAAWSVMIGGVAQLAGLLFAAKRAKLLLRMRRPRLTSGARRMIMLGTPGFIGAAALQINSIVGTNVASREEGAVSWLIYADQLYQLPLALIGIALGVVLMPAIGRAVKSGNEAGARAVLNRGVETALLFALPASAALIAMPNFLCVVLFQDLPALLLGGSRFNSSDAFNTGQAIFIYGFGVPAFVMQKVLASAYFAREDTKSPMTFALTAIAINAALSISLFPVIGFLSVPVSTICAAWTEVSLLASRLHRRAVLKPGAELAGRLVRMVLLAILMGGGIALALRYQDAIEPYLFGQSWLFLALLTTVAASFYLGLALLTGAVPLRHLRPVKTANS